MAVENPRKKFKRNHMDLGEDESFVFKHPYFLEKFTFSFRGYTPKVRKALEDIVKEMSGKICDQSGFLLTDHLTFASQHDGRNYYSIAYLAHSIKAEEPLDIQDYRFREIKEKTVYIDCCCLDIRSVLKAKYCHIDNFNNVKCSLCTQADVLVMADDIFIVKEYMS